MTQLTHSFGNDLHYQMDPSVHSWIKSVILTTIINHTYILLFKDPEYYKYSN